MISARGRAFRAGVGFVSLRGCVNQLLDAPGHVGKVFGLQAVQLVHGRLGGTQVLERSGIDRAVGSQHVGNDSAALSNNADPAGPAWGRRAKGGAVGLASVGLSEASHGNQFLAFREEGEAASLQCFSVGVGQEGDGQVVDHRVRVLLIVNVRDVAS